VRAETKAKAGVAAAEQQVAEVEKQLTGLASEVTAAQARREEARVARQAILQDLEGVRTSASDMRHNL
jgi:F0F1-type ATP synthase membrane subunit b/b'